MSRTTHSRPKPGRDLWGRTGNVRGALPHAKWARRVAWRRERASGSRESVALLDRGALAEGEMWCPCTDDAWCRCDCHDA